VVIPVLEHSAMQETAPRQYLDDAPREIQDLIYAGRKIPAVKLARDQGRLGLREAKEQVEAIEARMRARFPAAMPEKMRLGCGAALILVGVFLAIGVSFFLRAIG
jgi:ribosomal protein L7/L12